MSNLVYFRPIRHNEKQKGGKDVNKYSMSEEAKEARRAYRRAWNKANPDKVRAATQRYWEKKAALAPKGASGG